MPHPDPFQTEVAQIALEAARGDGFALGGGHALIAHDIVHRPTEDIDLFTDRTGGVTAAAERVATALRQAGLEVERVAETEDLSEVFYGFERDMIEYEVRRGTQTTRITLARLDRLQRPIAMAVGPVLHIEDVIGSKVTALATRAEPRDYIDVAAASHRYDRDQLLDLARRFDPSLADDEFSAAMRRLDRLPDAMFARYGLGSAQITDVRNRFSTWPRDL